MCGITGFLQPRRRFDDAEVARRLAPMVRVLRHRGPDDEGIWTDGVAGLGHTRLSIIDLSDAGHQPMADPAGHVVIVFNGEIYNFRDLRKELAGGGARFRSHSDTEVIVHGFLAWGTKVFDRLRGMFAIALWDARKRTLHLARDRVGKKPLVYGFVGDTFLFGSEIKALAAWPDFERQPDFRAIHHYLSLQYIPSPMTAFTGISKLPPGHLLSVKPGHSPRIRRYWELPKPATVRPRPVDILQKEFLAHLEEAVRLRMVADVPVGAFLSGGVDSSAVVAMMARQSTGRVRTFSIGFDIEGFDERQYARQVARHCGTEHEEFVVEPQIGDLLPDLVWHYNEPYADSSAVPSFHVARLASQHVKVVLNGDGGDESFLGYTRYTDLRERQWVDGIPHLLRRLASRVSETTPLWADRFRPTRVARRLLTQIGHLNSRLYEPKISYFTSRDKEAGYSPMMARYLGDNTLDILERYFAEAPSMVSGAAWADIHTYLPDDLLVKIDIASMAHSLEARSPLLDQELMTWAAGVPEDIKLRGGETKWLMKRSLEPMLPKEILYRPKMGFGVPIDHWLRDELYDLARDCLTAERSLARGLFAPDYGRTILQQHRDGTLLHHTRIWAMVMLELWFRSWIDESDPIGNRIGIGEDSSMPALAVAPG